MYVTIEQAQNYINYLLDTGTFHSNILRVDVTGVYDMTDSLHTHLNIALNMHRNDGKFIMSEFKPEKNDVIIFIQTVFRNGKIEDLLNGNT